MEFLIFLVLSFISAIALPFGMGLQSSLIIFELLGIENSELFLFSTTGVLLGASFSFLILFYKNISYYLNISRNVKRTKIKGPGNGKQTAHFLGLIILFSIAVIFIGYFISSKILSINSTLSTIISGFGISLMLLRYARKPLQKKFDILDVPAQIVIPISITSLVLISIGINPLLAFLMSGVFFKFNLRTSFTFAFFSMVGNALLSIIVFSLTFSIGAIMSPLISISFIVGAIIFVIVFKTIDRLIKKNRYLSIAPFMILISILLFFFVY